MIRNKLLLAASLLATLTTSAAFANKVEFSATDRDGTFYCVSNSIIDRFKTVDIDTDNVEVNGFCDGQEYVKTKGHVKGMTMSELNKFYFEYKIDNAAHAGSVNIIAANADDVTCYPGKGDDADHRKAYGNGKYC